MTQDIASHGPTPEAGDDALGLPGQATGEPGSAAASLFAALTESDDPVEILACALWREGRQAEAIEVLERQIAMERKRLGVATAGPEGIGAGQEIALASPVATPVPVPTVAAVALAPTNVSLAAVAHSAEPAPSPSPQGGGERSAVPVGTTRSPAMRPARDLAGDADLDDKGRAWKLPAWVAPREIGSAIVDPAADMADRFSIALANADPRWWPRPTQAAGALGGILLAVALIGTFSGGGTESAGPGPVAARAPADAGAKLDAGQQVGEPTAETDPTAVAAAPAETEAAPDPAASPAPDAAGAAPPEGEATAAIEEAPLEDIPPEETAETAAVPPQDPPPEGAAPETAAPDAVATDAAPPDETVPDETVPAEAVPADAVPAETPAEAVASVDPAPAEEAAPPSPEAATPRVPESRPLAETQAEQAPVERPPAPLRPGLAERRAQAESFAARRRAQAGINESREQRQRRRRVPVIGDGAGGPAGDDGPRILMNGRGLP